MELSPEELERQKRMVLEMCICGGCPSWVECGSYPVTEKMSLKDGYYCTRGSEKEQMGDVNIT